MDITAELHRIHLRATPQRIAILDALKRAERPCTAEELYESVTDMDLVTIYRTMEAFVRSGLVREVRFKDAVLRYEYAHGHHHHLVCTDCGVVEELADCHVAPLEKQVLKHSRRFKTISEHALEFFGLCKKCA